MATPEDRIKELGIELGEPTTPVVGANYVPAVRAGRLLFLSGHVPPAGTFVGKVGRDLTAEEGYQAARAVGASLLATIKGNLGDLNRVARIVKVLGMVNSADGFTQQSVVINGCSDLLTDVFGEDGRHARSSVGMAELPGGASVEIELIVEVAP